MSLGLITFTLCAVFVPGLLAACISVGSVTASITTTDDAITWSYVANPFTAYSYGLAYNGDKTWVAVGQGGNTMVYTTDTVTWNPIGNQNALFSANCEGVTYANGIWVAVGGSPAGIAFSSDGITWQQSVIQPFTTCFAAAFSASQGIWAAVGVANNGWSATSPDGNSWTFNVGTTVFTTGYSITYCDFCNSWIAGGTGSTFLAVSSDAVNWNVVTAANGLTKTFGVACNSKLCIAVGDNTISDVLMFSSSDGNTWNPIQHTLYAYGNDVMYAPLYKLWISNGVAGLNSIITSTDGVNWVGRGAVSAYSYGTVCNNFGPTITPTPTPTPEEPTPTPTPTPEEPTPTPTPTPTPEDSFVIAPSASPEPSPVTMYPSPTSQPSDPAPALEPAPSTNSSISFENTTISFNSSVVFTSVSLNYSTIFVNGNFTLQNGYISFGTNSAVKVNGEVTMTGSIIDFSQNCNNGTFSGAPNLEFSGCANILSSTFRIHLQKCSGNSFSLSKFIQLNNCTSILHSQAEVISECGISITPVTTLGDLLFSSCQTESTLPILTISFGVGIPLIFCILGGIGFYIYVKNDENVELKMKSIFKQKTHEREF